MLLGFRVIGTDGTFAFAPGVEPAEPIYRTAFTSEKGVIKLEQVLMMKARNFVVVFVSELT